MISEHCETVEIMHVLASNLLCFYIDGLKIGPVLYLHILFKKSWLSEHSLF